jgi:hypothetical protein
MTDTNSETLYELVHKKAGLVRRSGLRETLSRIDPKLRDRRQAGIAIKELYSLGWAHKHNPKSGADLNYAEFLISEAIDAAYKLDMQLSRFVHRDYQHYL